MIRNFLPAKVLSKVFRGKFTEGLKNAFRRGALQFPGALQAIGTDKTFRAFLRTLFRKNWVVYAKPPFRGPEHVLQYLARYTHRVAISNHRIVNVADGQVTFRWKDYAHGGKQRKMTLSASEFLRLCCRSAADCWTIIPVHVWSHPRRRPRCGVARGAAVQ